MYTQYYVFQLKSKIELNKMIFFFVFCLFPFLLWYLQSRTNLLALMNLDLQHACKIRKYCH